VAEAWDGARLVAGGFERVYVELEWYDGPRAGVAAVGGAAHYFEACGWDEAGEYRVWPVGAAVLALEREQWAIFVRWNRRYEAGTAGVGSHPGQGGVDDRYDELDALLAPHRRAPAGARTVVGEMRFDAGERYRADGVGYWFRWRPGADGG
jgi:hypothetical protein